MYQECIMDRQFNLMHHYTVSSSIVLNMYQVCIMYLVIFNESLQLFPPVLFRICIKNVSVCSDKDLFVTLVNPRNSGFTSTTID